MCWRSLPQPEVPEPEVATADEPAKQEAIEVDDIEQSAYEQIETFLDKKTPYEFQDLAAALLCGMGYFTPFVAPTGRRMVPFVVPVVPSRCRWSGCKGCNFATMKPCNLL